MPFEWTEKYGVGIRELDEQHRVLLGMVGEVARAAAQGKPVHEIQSVVTRLRHYAKEHFSSEERWMRHMEHPELEAHQEEHEAFMKQIGRFQRSCRSGECSLTGEVLPFLDTWLHDHFLNRDMAYARQWAESSQTAPEDS